MTDTKNAVCPDCGMANVTVLTAPLGAPKMYCTNCQWESLDDD